MSALDEKFDLIANGTDDFLTGLKGVDNELAIAIIKIYSKFVQRGELVLNAEQLAAVDEAVIAAIAATGYKDILGVYIPNFDALKALNVDIHKLENGINVQDVLLEADKIKNHQAVVEAQLRGTPSAQIQVTDIVDGKKVKRTVPIRNASLDELVQPISNQIRQDIILGVSFESATEAMLDAIADGNLGLEQWAGQVAMDALSQHDGIQQQAIKEEFDMKYSRYIGTIKKTTRPICYHLLTTKDDPVYTDDELKKVLGEYIPGGIPSESTTTSTADGKQQKKGNGLIPGTDINNFIIRKGGYRCRHELIPTLLE